MQFNPTKKGGGIIFQDYEIVDAGETITRSRGIWLAGSIGDRSFINAWPYSREEEYELDELVLSGYAEYVFQAANGDVKLIHLVPGSRIIYASEGTFVRGYIRNEIRFIIKGKYSPLFDKQIEVPHVDKNSYLYNMIKPRFLWLCKQARALQKVNPDTSYPPKIYIVDKYGISEHDIDRN